MLDNGKPVKSTGGDKTYQLKKVQGDPQSALLVTS